MNSDLKIIKKKYGEKMMHFCREFFHILLEKEGLLSSLLLNNFNASHYLYNDLVENNLLGNFKNYIYSLVDVENLDEEQDNISSPEELLALVGYDLYECHTEEEIQSFRKYYAPGEELCTFNGERLNRCYVFFAVKKNVDNIKREDFLNPKRQDEYGTSVISIQFDRSDAHTLSIKNRYNHTVNNPDNTFGSNLDNIIYGLTESFGKFYGLVQQHPNNNFELNNYVRAGDGKYYKYNHEINNVYFCPNNIIIDNFEVKRYDKEKYIIFNYFILDLVKKEVRLYDQKIKDSFPSTISNIQRIEVKRIEEKKEIKIILKDKGEIIIVLDKDNRMIKLKNQVVKEIGDNFLFLIHSLEEVDLSSLEVVGDWFLDADVILKKLSSPSLKKVGGCFLNNNRFLEELDLPSVEKVGNCFLGENIILKKLSAPSLKEVGNYFLYKNKSLKELDLSSLEKIGMCFLSHHPTLNYGSVQVVKRKGK